ncbi:MAG TPA: FAD-dependent oxidoreductase [Bacteriovoracaceae bacterium]|nr:FAD-dependent oxidoreductase [Bacteriovoracaceae bacterium]
MTTSHWLKPHTFKTSDISTDILIVGGGFAGLSTAYWISELKPDLKVTILERGVCGSSASGRNAGFLTKGSASFYQSLITKWGRDKALEIFRFAEDSIELVQNHIFHASPEIKFERSSSFTLMDKPLEADFQDFNFTWKQHRDLPAKLQDRFSGAYEGSNELKINPIQLMDSLKKIVGSRKVQIIEKSSAFEITPEGASTDANRIKAKAIVLALNGYFPEFHDSFRGLIKPYRAQMLAVELEDELECPALYYDPSERVYWRKTTSKVLLIGGKRLLDVTGEQSNFDKISPVIQKGLETYLSEKLKLKYKVLNRWAGVMGFTDHELPLISEIKAPARTFMLGGFSGHGIGFGFRSGREVAELLTGVKSSSFFSQFHRPEISL